MLVGASVCTAICTTVRTAVCASVSATVGTAVSPAVVLAGGPFCAAVRGPVSTAVGASVSSTVGAAVVRARSSFRASVGRSVIVLGHFSSSLSWTLQTRSSPLQHEPNATVVSGGECAKVVDGRSVERVVQIEEPGPQR